MKVTVSNFTKIVLSCTLILLFNILGGFCADVPQFIKDNQVVNIDISDLVQFYETLPIDEKTEQLRDWAIWGLLAKTGKNDDLSQDDAPMRYNYYDYDTKSAIAPGRVKFLSTKDCIILLETGKLSDKPLIGNIIDVKYASNNYMPERIHVYGYTVDFDSKTIRVKYAETVTSKKIFSKEYGYTESEIKSADDMKNFVSEIDDITSVRWKEKSVILGGRKYFNNNLGSLSYEDIAVLYQAYNVLSTPAREEQNKRDYNIFINQKYDEVLRNNRKLKKAIEQGQVKRNQILEEIRRRIPYQSIENRDVNVGFSLDPQRDYATMAEDIVKITKKDPEFVHPADAELIKYIDNNTTLLNSTADRIKRETSLEPLLLLRRKFVNTNDGTEKRFDNVLALIDQKNSYQTARYDGKLQGTMPGMILFYTDLTAKLYALNFNNLTPRDKVTGFLTMPEIKVPKLYWDDFTRLSNTRLWFGLLTDAFEVYDKKLLFKPVATRVYAASSDPLYPGKESKPNYQSGKFLGWWDAHYTAVADHEPQYYKHGDVFLPC
jgi:hypothetical protein